jgi:hypothetical protein
LKEVVAPLKEVEERTHYHQQHWVSLPEKIKNNNNNNKFLKD